MQIRSNLFSELAMSGNARMETSVTIGETAYAPGSVVTVSRAAGQNALSVGNAVSATVQFSLAATDLDGVDIPRTSAAVVKCRFTDGRRVSEWLTVGTFYVTRRQNDPVNGLFEFQGFDAMQKANAPFPALSDFPKAMNSAVMEIASEMGVEVDGRTWESIPTGGDYYVPLPADNLKMIAVLGYIGGVCGGNWVITPQNRLRLVPLASASDAEDAEDKVEIAGIMSAVTVGAPVAVTGVEATTGAKRVFAGSDAGGIVSALSNPYAKQAHVNALLTRYDGLSYAPFEIRGGIYDPAAEIGDYIVSRDDVRSVIWQETARYGPAFRGDLSAPTALETSETERSLSDAISDSGAVAEDLSVRIYRFVSRSPVTVADGQSAEIINFDFAAGAEQDVIFHAEVKHTTETTETGDATDGWTVGDAVLTVTYYINGAAVTSYHPVKTETDGENLLHLTYHFTNGQYNAGNFRVTLSLSGGSVTVAAGDAIAYIIGQGYSGTDDNWVTEDGLVFIGVESYPDKMDYETGDALDYTGLVVKAYYADGREKDVTADCSIAPAAGTALDEEGETVISLSYTEDGAEDGAEFRDSFSVYCVGDQYRILYIDVITPPTKTEYLTVEKLNLAGLVIGAYQENGHVIVNIKPECVFSPAEGDALSTPGTVTVTATKRYNETLEYGTFNAYFDVSVKDAKDAKIIASDDWWTLYDNGLLDIYCEGDVPNYNIESAQPWYQYHKQITSVMIQDSVTTIGRSAFNGCTSLTSVTIPESVTRIWDQAFRRCTSLTSVTIPESVKIIEESVFGGCTSLTSVTIPDVGTIERSAFSGCTSLTSVTIPDSVTTIYNFAFAGCKNLTSVTLPNRLQTLGAGDSSYYTGVFSGCTSLTSVTIPDSVTTIGNTAFSGCTSLTSVTIGDSVTSIPNYAFSGCASLTSVTIPDSVTTIGQGAFSMCTSLTSVTIPNNVTSIGNYAFNGCTSLTSVTIPKRVLYIRDYAFYNTALKSVTISYYAGVGSDAFPPDCVINYYD